MDLVSVIIPLYNVEQYLERTIQSVAEQSYKNLEIILIDDGSTDQCPHICDKWAQKDNRIRVIHQKNGGVSAARNAGLEASSGEYIMQVDSDDYIAPYAVERMIEAAQKESAALVICDFVQGTEDYYEFLPEEAGAEEIVDAQTALRRIYESSHNALMYAVPWAKLYKKCLFENIRYPDGKIFEDIYTTHKLLFKCKSIAVVHDALFYYYQRENSIMNAKFHIKKLDYLQALVERVDFFKANNLTELAQIAYDELLHSLIWEYSRTRDVLHSREGMEYVKNMYRSVYKKGHASKRYPDESARFLAAFNQNPEWIVWYWRIKAKLAQMINKRNG